MGQGITVDPSVYLWVAVALIGGFVGAYFGSTKFSNPVLKKILAFVLLIASIKLLSMSEK